MSRCQSVGHHRLNAGQAGQRQCDPQSRVGVLAAFRNVSRLPVPSTGRPPLNSRPDSPVAHHPLMKVMSRRCGVQGRPTCPGPALSSCYGGDPTDEVSQRSMRAVEVFPVGMTLGSSSEKVCRIAAPEQNLDQSLHRRDTLV